MRSGTSVFGLARGLLSPGNIRILALTSMLTGIYISMLNTILQPFVVEYLGFDVAILGALVAVGARPTGLASSIIQPFAGHLADVLGRKRLILLGSAVGIGSMLSFLVAAMTRGPVALSLGYVLLGLSLLGNPASQAMIAESVSMDPGMFNVAYSVVFFFTSLPGAIVPFLVGYMGYTVIFGLAAILEAVNLFALFPQLRETQFSSPVDIGAGRRFSFRESVRIPRGFVRIFIPFAMDAFSWGIGGAIIYGMWASYFGFSNLEIGIIFGSFSLSIVASQYFATRLLLAVGARRTLGISEFLAGLILLGWLLDQYLPFMVLVAVVFGFSVALWVPAVSSLLMVTAPAEERGSILGKLAAVRGLIAFPAPVIGGLIYTVYGYYVPVFLSLVGEFVTTLAILKLLPETHQPPLQTVSPRP